MNSKQFCQLSALLAMIVASVVVAMAQSRRVASIDFPTSGSKEAQAYFLKGVIALHNFWYDEAAEAFLEAQKIDANFAMAYWGEAMTYNHPLWAEQDLQGGRKALARFGPDRKTRLDKIRTPREKAYVEAVETLYGEGDKLSRDTAYSAEMEKVAQQYPHDIEAACFYALSVLGTVRPGEKGFPKQIKSAAILEEVFRKNPNHPGAVHYLIHAYDDPAHARLGLPAARRYAELAANAPHALHMPSHIFLQLGMWDEAARSNEAAYAASVDWVKGKQLPPTKRDYHSLAWMQFAYLQQGRYAKAREVISMIRHVAEETGDLQMKALMASMTSRYAIETGLLEGMGEAPQAFELVSGVLLGEGMSAVEKGDLSTAEKVAGRITRLKEQNRASGRDYNAKPLAIMENEVRALVSLATKRDDEAVQLLKDAVAIEGQLDPPSGPPEPMKPATEMFGEILLQLKRPREAVDQFQTALLRMPNRAASVIGLARAYAMLDDRKSASTYYGQLLNSWHEADPNLPRLHEARRFMAQNGGF